MTVAKRTLRAGEVLDGEGGYTVWAKAVPSRRSLAEDCLPIGLAHGVRLKRDVAQGELVRKADVTVDETSEVMRLRAESEDLVG